MQDLLLAAGKNPLLRSVFSEIGVPTPVPIERQSGPVGIQPLAGKKIVVSSGAAHALVVPLAAAGADVFTVQGAGREAGTQAIAFGRQILDIAKLQDEIPVHGLLFDAGDMDAENLTSVYEFFHRHVARLQKNGRALIIARGGDAVVLAALEGFMRSLAKEIGGRAATANMICANDAAATSITGPALFFMSRASCYVTGQVLRLSPGGEVQAAANAARPLEGKVALVTGAARGIGAEITMTLAAEGAHVVCLDRPEESEALAATARRIDGHIFYQNLAAENAADNISAYFSGKFKGCDIVVHNAGITLDKTLKKMPVESWQRVMNINLAAPMDITRRMLADAALKKNCRVICLSSIAGIAGNFGQTNYAASKAGVRGFVAAMAPEFAKTGSTINAVAPGFIETRMTAAMPLFTREVGRRLNNLGQGGMPADVAQVVSFLAQPAAAAVSGQTLRVCGGSLIGA